MPLTREFRETVKARATEDAEFRAELLRESLEAFVVGDVDVAKSLLRNYINATVGFETLGRAIDKPPKSLMRMLSAEGNPSLKNLMQVTRYLQQDAGIAFQVVTQGTATRRKSPVSH